MSDTASTDIIQNSVISVLIENESGALARVVGLFSGRGYNISSLTVAQVDERQGLSRITVLTSGTPMVIQQIKAQLKRLVPVHAVSDLTEEGAFVGRELALVKIVSSGEDRTEALRIAESFRARRVDSTATSFVFELTGSPEKIDAFIELMRNLGLADISRTGIAAIARGPEVFAPLVFHPSEETV
ncbi:acetolactate synthase small subunit [Neokomagataea anthophila]|uniref:Acetolactate synthase small subunit n=1 Tax=Neokomagataea anthophila TaxID=2826925 RepID=A0ABS5E5V4_9PROT|nr:acetolactate synthase small subunit [Neokomagataea anthophila]MBR0558908.1 acetolactate synthase small subunit [Neokomagataea anthophila]